jgi:hypothetical protein
MNKSLFASFSSEKEDFLPLSQPPRCVIGGAGDLKKRRSFSAFGIASCGIAAAS